MKGQHHSHKGRNTKNKRYQQEEDTELVDNSTRPASQQKKTQNPSTKRNGACNARSISQTKAYEYNILVGMNIMSRFDLLSNKTVWRRAPATRTGREEGGVLVLVLYYLFPKHVLGYVCHYGLYKFGRSDWWIHCAIYILDTVTILIVDI